MSKSYLRTDGQPKTIVRNPTKKTGFENTPGITSLNLRGNLVKCFKKKQKIYFYVFIPFFII